MAVPVALLLGGLLLVALLVALVTNVVVVVMSLPLCSGNLKGVVYVNQWVSGVGVEWGRTVRVCIG